ncbi:MAG: nucleotide exchange factor GrpE [Kiloniellales bacterium]
MQNQKPSDLHQEKPANEAPSETQPGPEDLGEAPGVAAEAAEAAAAEAEAAQAEVVEEDLDPVAALQAEIEILNIEMAKLKDQALRAMADAENTRRRVERDKADAVKYASLPLLRDLVKVADNMSRALAHGGGEDKEESAGAKALREGVALTEKELLAAFDRHGVIKIDPAGQPLDPERHEAMIEIPDENAEPGTIVQVFEPGWILHGRLIRPARVGVAKKP